MKKIINLKLETMYGYQQFKNIFAKGSTPNYAEVFANKKV